MSNEIPATQEQKLKTLRKILWFFVVGISIPLVTLGAISYLVLINLVNTGQFNLNRSFATLVYLPWIGMVVVALVIAAICLVIYYVIKYRLERDDELFL
jgi:uncharacterized membrane protein YqjE